MAHIIDFSISGLAGRDDVYSRKLNRGINVFYGLNGSGKTSLLRILHSAMTQDARILRNVPFQSATVKVYSMDYKKAFTYSTRRRVEAREPDTGPDVVSDDISLQEGLFDSERGEQEELTWVRVPKREGRATRRRGWRHEYLPTTRLYVGDIPFEFGRRIVRRGGDELSEEALDMLFARSLQRLWSKYSNQVLSRVGRAQEAGLARILKAVLTSPSVKTDREPALDAPTAYRSVLSFLKGLGARKMIGSKERFLTRYEESAELQSVVHEIADVEQGIQKAMAQRHKLQELVTTMVSGNKELEFTDTSIEVVTHQGERIQLATLSSGEKHLVRMFLGSLFAEDNSILIDEPEISLHVDWQKGLINAMRLLNPSAQMILATHSPEILSNLRDNWIFAI